MALAQITIRRGTTAEWAAANPVLGDGEMGYDSTLKRVKVGDGVSSWVGLGWSTMAPGEVQSVLTAATIIDQADTPTDASVANLITTPGSQTNTQLSAAFAAHVAAQSGETPTAATARLNAALASGEAFGVAQRTVTLVGDFTINAHLTVPSNTTVDARGATITMAPDSHDYIIGNVAVAAIATVPGVGAMAASAAITSSAAFLAEHEGKQVAVAGAGWNGSPLYGTLSRSTASAATVRPVVAAEGTADVKALTTVAGATMSVFGRDHNITIIGGKWIRLANTGPTAADDRRLHLMMFRRLDGIKVIDAEFEAYQVAKYCINLGDVSDYAVVRPKFHDTISDGVHINGPAIGGLIEGVRGKTEDDIVSFTAADYWEPGMNAKFNDVSGDILGCEVIDMSPSGAKSGLKILGGGQHKVRGVHASGVHGWVTRRPVYVADDLTGSSDVSVTIDGLDCRPGDGYNSVFINATNAKDVSIRDMVPYISATQTFPPVQLATGALVDRLTLGVVARDVPGNLSILQVNSGCTINELEFSGAVSYPSVATGIAIAVLGTISRIKLVGATHLKNAKAFIKQDSAAGAMAVDVGSAVTSDNCEFIAWSNATTALSMRFAGGYLDNFGGYIRAQSTGALTVTGEAPRGLRAVSSGIRRDSTAVVRVISPGMPCDVSVISKNNGDAAFNSNAALACGAGRVISDGASWKNVFSGATY